MLEDSVLVMEKKGAPRQSSNLAKPNAAFERKSDPSSTVRYHGRYNRRRDNGSGRGTPSDFSSRKPIPQKTRSALDKRPRQRGGFGGRQREEVAEVEEAETGSSFQQGRPRKGDVSHLLNFTFAGRENVSNRPYRPKYWKKNFSKEQYLQANCQFVVKDCGDYSVQACDPDALVNWDLVEQVRTFSFGQTTCPICLQPPFAGKITKCGHVYCWACILHYLSLDDKNSRRCPICFDDVSKSDLRSVKVVEKQEHKVGDVITMHLMKRARDSTYAVPCAHWEDREGQPQHILDELNTEYAKVLVASASEIHTAVIEEEREALLLHLACAEDSEICFIESALVLLSEREVCLKDKSLASQENQAVMDKLGAGNDSGNQEKGNSNGGAGTKTDATPPSPPLVTKPLPRNMSFDGSKIRKQYADAFEELEEEEEEESVVSGELSDHEDEESFDSVMSMSSPSPDHCLSLPMLIPGAHGPAASSEEEPLSVPSDDGLPVLPPDTEEVAMTTEEAVEQLEMPTDRESSAAGVRNTNTPKTGGVNKSKPYFYFYQASDGQQIYLHSVNARCICHEYGSLEQGPQTITAKIVDKEITFMNGDIRKRVRYLNHVPKACEFQIVEVQLQPPTVSHNTLHHFVGELKRRAQYRQKVRREDRRLAKKQNIQEKMSYGIYPEVRLALDNPDHFPAPAAEGGERRRNSSLTDVASLASTPGSTPDLNVNAPEFVPAAKCEVTPPSTPSFSFAAALKKAKQPPPSSVWGSAMTSSSTSSTQASAGPAAATGSRRPDSEDSDSEDRMPVPLFKNSFSDAISTKLETLTSKEQGDQAGSKGGKKKKKEKKLLFSTDMMRR
ncbi:E3 ubiquitin-protein ligase RNF10-like [Babylonia areolata]|uniref:E3 ubiquitin-protein ligase RNF10-like n=1 Tax=Babylonia areolata TaxID=304850 RepID=UPI003FCFF760